MHMNGRGIMERTEELIDAVWDALIPAWLGMSAAFGGPFFSWAFLIHRFPWDPPVTVGYWIAAGVISAFSFVGGVWLSTPWFKATRTLRAHTERLKQETAERGKGWADR